MSFSHVAADGSVLLRGNFTSVDGMVRPGLARVTASGRRIVNQSRGTGSVLSGSVCAGPRSVADRPGGGVRRRAPVPAGHQSRGARRGFRRRVVRRPADLARAGTRRTPPGTGALLSSDDVVPGSPGPVSTGSISVVAVDDRGSSGRNAGQQDKLAGA